MAMQLLDSDQTQLATYWDSDDSNATPDFDKGTINERLLYFPNIKDEEEEEEDADQTENLSRAEEGEDTNTVAEEDEPDVEDQFYHFAILFNTDGSLVSDGLSPLEVELDDDSKAGYTLYSKFYSSDDENPFIQDTEFTVLIVLNASYDLQQRLQDKIEKLTKTSKDCYDSIRKFTLDWNNSDALLYLKDKKGNYITDEDGNLFFTMTSSMVIDSYSKVMPAIETTEGKKLFQTYNNEDLAKENPTTIYVERLASKYTVVFKGDNGNYYYLKSLDTDLAQADEEFYLTRSTGDSSNPIPEEHLIYTVGNSNYLIKTVNDYTRNSDITQRGKPEIEKAEWWVNILGWDINASESQEYLFKVINPGTFYYTNWDKVGGSEIKYRNFWAEDLHYTIGTGSYPWQYRKIYKNCRWVHDNEGHMTLYWDPDDNSSRSLASITSPALTYNDFTTLSKRNVRRYMVENTFDYDLMINQGGQDPYHDAVFLRTGSHLIVTAQLLVKGIDSDYLFSNPGYDLGGLRLAEGNKPAESKYYMNDIYWSESAYKNYVAEYLAYFMMDDDYQKIDVFGRNNGNFYVLDSHEMRLATGDDFEFEHACIKGGDNFVYITPKEGIILYTFNPDETEEDKGEGEGEDDEAGEENPDPDNVEETASDQGLIGEGRAQDSEEIPLGYHEVTLDKYLNLVYAHPELMAAHFNQGRMYYVAGSTHNKDSENFSEGIQRVSTGDYGTVRNNWYAFTIDQISAPGTGVDIIEQPIVPNNYNRKAIAVGFSILPWHDIYTSVDTGDQKRPGQTTTN